VSGEGELKNWRLKAGTVIRSGIGGLSMVEQELRGSREVPLGLVQKGPCPCFRFHFVKRFLNIRSKNGNLLERRAKAV
jgi:hypothetical protein